MTVDIHTGEIVTGHITATEARVLTDRIRGGLTVAYDGLVEAFAGRADLALGYESWDAYCASEFTEGRMVRLDREQRREIVGSMREAGMSTRAIGSALGVNDRTVRNDMSSAEKSADAPATVTSLDGRQRPASRPTPDLDHEFWDETAERLTADGTVARLDAERPYGVAIAGLRNNATEITGLGLDPTDLGRNVPAVSRPALADIAAAHAWLGAFLDASNGARP